MQQWRCPRGGGGQGPGKDAGPGLGKRVNEGEPEEGQEGGKVCSAYGQGSDV
jgi:hypothetical protein